jgi:hypothetical protein
MVRSRPDLDVLRREEPEDGLAIPEADLDLVDENRRLRRQLAALEAKLDPDHAGVRGCDQR